MLDGQAGQRALITSMDHSCQFNFRQIQKSNISAFQSPGDNFDFLPTFDFSMPGDLLVPKLHTFNSNFNSNYCLYKSVESFLVEESAYISIAVSLFMIKRDVFFQLFPRCVDLGGTGLTDLLRPSIAMIVCEFAHLSLPAFFG